MELFSWAGIGMCALHRTSVTTFKVHELLYSYMDFYLAVNIYDWGGDSINQSY